MTSPQKRKPHKKKLHKNALTKPHKFEVNSTKSRSLTHFEILLLFKKTTHPDK